MKEELLQKIIEEIDENELKQKAVFGVFQFGGGSDESYIRANKEGLELFGIQLLKSIGKSADMSSANGKNIMPLAYYEDWMDESSDTIIHYIEISPNDRKWNPEPKQGSEFISQLYGFGCIMIFIVIVLATIVGIVTIFTWL